MSVRIGPGKWTYTPQTRPDACLRLLCFHHSGGGAYGFRDWAPRLRPEVELVAVQLPGRENRFTEPALASVEAVLDGLIAHLPDVLGHHYALFGHSLGASLAYLLAERVSRTGELAAPQRLFVSAAPAPTVEAPAEEEPEDLSDNALIDRLARLGGTPAKVLQDRSVMDTFLPTLRADFALVEQVGLRQARILDTPITALRGVQDPVVAAEDMSGWPKLSSRPSQVHAFPGGHFYFREAFAATLDIINTALGADLRRLAAATA